MQEMKEKSRKKKAKSGSRDVNRLLPVIRFYVMDGTIFMSSQFVISS